MVRDGVKNEKSTRESVIQGYYGGGPPSGSRTVSVMALKIACIEGILRRSFESRDKSFSKSIENSSRCSGLWLKIP